MNRAVGAVGALALALAVAACGGTHRGSPTVGNAEPPPPAHAAPRVATGTDGLVALLPPGAQVVVEVDLARLEANEAVGKLVHWALAGDVMFYVPGVPKSPLARATQFVLAAYGVGTADAATVILLATEQDKFDVPEVKPVAKGVVGIGPQGWLDQVAARAALPDVAIAAELAELRAHAMPDKAPGAAARLTARLSFDARISLARMTGLDQAPAQLSVWLDVADDLAVIVDADSADPGEKKPAAAAKATQQALAAALRSLASDPTMREIGIAPSIADARFAIQGTWVRAIITIGPARLARAVARAMKKLPEGPM